MPSPCARTIRTIGFAFVSLLGSLAIPCRAPLGAQAAFATLKGVVTDAVTQQPVTGVRVVIAATGRYATTDSLGVFELKEIPSGVIRFFFAAPGYPRTSVVLALAKGETMVQRFELESIAAEAAATTTLGRATGDAAAGPGQPRPATEVIGEASRGVRYEDFERRLKTGRGQYVTREVIEERAYNNLSDAVRGLRGVAIECGGSRGCLIRMARSLPGCYPQYIVDGRPDNFFGPNVAVRDIEGIEVYSGAADVPGEFAGTDAGCGVVVIWTRNGPPPPRRP
ncbi:MAG: carboxypeptidase regulatory-like domain-containing protein [Gemmatimonadaceae bacterium]